MENNKQKLIEAREQLKQILDNYNDALRHNSEITIEEIESMLKELEEIKKLVLQESASLESKLRKLSILIQ